MAKLRVGDVVKFCIKKITYFGIFCELEGVTALIHPIRSFMGCRFRHCYMFQDRSVSKGRFLSSPPGLSPTFQVYMEPMFENQYKLLARAGNRVQEWVSSINFDSREMGSSVEQNILVTGGAGFIGTHTVVQLLKEGFKVSDRTLIISVSIIDNLDNSVIEAVDRVRELVGPDLSKKLDFTQGDLRNKGDIEKLFSKQRFDAVIHFAGLKAVGESVANPRRYFDNNLVGTIHLYETMAKYNCKMMVFSSSATVYGQPEKIPCMEDFELKAMNPYGRTKLFLEEIARDIQAAEPEWRIVLLRYFNPVGAHESGRIGEDPKGIPNNLMPYIQQVAVGRLPELNVYGHDYPTEDGSAVRDYIHVMDLADGHIAALRKLFADPKIGCTAYNLGTGRGTSVLEMVAAFEKASGKKIPIKLCPRRPGDATAVYASTERAEKELGWKAKYGVDEMCRDQWKWANNNPWGYQKKP
ncbi:hypothetical protein Bca52824_013168 [Brassica carinata]|uniref:UDP-glucose 4-epimerase n=1 Tax=Brassica carinata TaxID=52824 RepID=A0A8X7VZU8_BRACI|nr:hypothetical protein Bca52824_013168 [Brassica carinata]